jgi:Ser/Thr protein kinase RdoA (MazF antagonist)
MNCNILGGKTMTISDLISIPEQWGLTVEASTYLSPRVLLIKTNEGEYIVKKKENIENALKEVTLLNKVEVEGIKIQKPIASKIGKYTFKHNNDVFVVYEYLDGEIIDARRALGNFLMHSLGETIGLLHKSLNNTLLESQFPKRDLYQIVYGWAFKEVMNVHNNQQLESIHLSLEEDIKRIVTELPKQLIHRDTHVTNFVFEGERPTGVLDFEIAEVNVRIFDICYCSTSVLSEVFDNSDKRQEWYTFIARLVRGYSRVNPLNDLEVRSMWHVMLCIQSIFMAFFCNDLGLFEANKRMFLWIYENREHIEKTLEVK